MTQQQIAQRVNLPDIVQCAVLHQLKETHYHQPGLPQRLDTEQLVPGQSRCLLTFDSRHMTVNLSQQALQHFSEVGFFLLLTMQVPRYIGVYTGVAQRKSLGNVHSLCKLRRYGKHYVLQLRLAANDDGRAVALPMMCQQPVVDIASLGIV